MVDLDLALPNSGVVFMTVVYSLNQLLYIYKLIPPHTGCSNADERKGISTFKYTRRGGYFATRRSGCSCMVGVGAGCWKSEMIARGKNSTLLSCQLST